MKYLTTKNTVFEPCHGQAELI